MMKSMMKWERSRRIKRTIESHSKRHGEGDEQRQIGTLTSRQINRGRKID